MGDPRAVAKQQIFNETVKNELRHLDRNRTKDFAINPRSGKCCSTPNRFSGDHH